MNSILGGRDLSNLRWLSFNGGEYVGEMEVVMELKGFLTHRTQ